MTLPNDRLMDITEIKQKIAAGDLKQKNGSTLPTDSPLCPDFDEMDEWVDLDTSSYVNDGYSLHRCTTLGKPEFQDYVTVMYETLLHTLDNPSHADSTEFGYAVAISDTYTVIGTPYAADGYQNSGMLYVFNSSTGALLRTIRNPNPYGTRYNDYFGCSVDISGNYCIVGAYGEDESGNASNPGKAYLYDISSGSLMHTFDNPHTLSNILQFGKSVAISNSYIVIGAGASIYVYNKVNNALLGSLSGTSEFGSAVATDGNYCIIGANDDSNGGKAYIYDINNSYYTHILNNPNSSGVNDYDHFGNSVDISGNYCIVGAHYDTDDAGQSNSGRAYIFNVSTGALVHTLDNPNAYGSAESDQFGESVAISGNYCIVGADYEDPADTGKAYIFNVSTGALLSTIDDPNAYGSVAYDNFGTSVAISDSYCIVSAPKEDEAGHTDTGKVYIFG